MAVSSTKRLAREFRCDEGRTHSLEMLIETIRAISPDYPEFDLGDLTAFANRSRYPLVCDMHTVQSHNNVPIRLSPERWGHISQNHPELAGYLYDVLEAVEAPEEIREGNSDALIAIRTIESGKVLAVVYKETSSSDGFIITAFLTRELNWLHKKSRIWQ